MRVVNDGYLFFQSTARNITPRICSETAKKWITPAPPIAAAAPMSRAAAINALNEETILSRKYDAVLNELYLNLNRAVTVREHYPELNTTTNVLSD